MELLVYADDVILPANDAHACDNLISISMLVLSSKTSGL